MKNRKLLPSLIFFKVTLASSYAETSDSIIRDFDVSQYPDFDIAVEIELKLRTNVERLKLENKTAWVIIMLIGVDKNGVGYIASDLQYPIEPEYIKDNNRFEVGLTMRIEPSAIDLLNDYHTIELHYVEEETDSKYPFEELFNNETLLIKTIAPFSEEGLNG